jgi:ferredoxin
MVRKIIRIDGEACNGCGLCAEACHEGAIGIVDGKARLLREDYCDGLGNCLPVCPAGAIAFVEREAKEYDEEAVKMTLNMTMNTTNKTSKTSKTNKTKKEENSPPSGGCPGTRPGGNTQTIERDPPSVAAHSIPGRLTQWPIQIKLVPVNAPYFNGANLLVSADCGAYARGSFHDDFMRNRVVLIGCPKLDEGDYREKLAEIIRRNDITSVMVVRMEVPCCGGIEHAVAAALKDSGKMIPLKVITLSISGEIVSG